MSIKATLRNESKSIAEFHYYDLVDLNILNSQNYSPDPETNYIQIFLYESYLIVKKS